MRILVALLAGCSALVQPHRLPYRVVLPGTPDQYEVMRMDGRWGKEYSILRHRLGADGMTLECRSGRSANPNKPWLLMRHVRTGEGLGLSIAYSGNWTVRIARQGERDTEVVVDTHPGGLEVFRTPGGMPVPGVLVAHFRGDWDEGALPITRFIRAQLLRRDLPDWPWVMYNTWYDRYEKLDEGRLLKLARRASDLGCELFVIDAGWYGADPDWSKSVGDWRVNEKRFPHGLEPVIEEVRRRGMRFGLWVEIESVWVDAPVRKEHPDWVLRAGDRGILNFGRPEAVAWAKGRIDELMGRYRLDYIKMDFNADPGDVPWVHVRGVYELWTYLRERYPALAIENCASGSLRMDAAAAAFTDTHWVSDEVSDASNVTLNLAATYAFPPEICNHWTCFPQGPDAFRASMLGQFGLSGGILEWSDDLLSAARESIREYKELRPLLRRAEVYHVAPDAAQYYVPDAGESVVFVFGKGPGKLLLRRIDPSRRYAVRGGKLAGSELEVGGPGIVRVIPE